MTITISNDAAEPFSLGTTDVTWTANDGNGQSITCTQTVTVEDNQDPMITCPDDVTVDADLGSCNATGVTLVNAAATDNCTTITISNNATEPYSLGDNTVTWTANDGNGQSVTCTQTVTVEDNQNPVAICPTDMPIVSIDENGVGTLAENALAGNSTDNCGVASETSPEITYECDDTRTHIVTLTVKDASGNSHSTDCTIEVIDSIDPVAVCPESTIVTLDEFGMGTLPLNALIGNSTDNCEVAEEISAPASYDCDDIGTETVTLIASDNSGNLNTIACDITIVDEIPPVITCPSDLVVSTDAGTCSASGVTLGTATVTDNCETIIATNDGTTTYGLGVTIVTWTGTYNVDQTVTCEQTVTVEDNENPVAICPEVTPVVSLGMNGEGTLEADALGGNSNDNCSLISQTSPATTFNCSQLGTQTIMLTVVDGSENSNSTLCNITVEDNYDPVITCPDNVTVNTDAGSCDATSVSLGSAAASDNCATAITPTNNANEPFSLGANTVTWTADDGNGNSVTCTQIVTVNDNEDPTIACPTDVVVNTDAGSCDATGVSLGSATASDNCAIAITPTSDAIGTTYSLSLIHI